MSPNINQEIAPSAGLKGLSENWQNDLIAAINVGFVALPLSLGIALASGMQPIAGILSAVIGGIVTTFFRGSHIGINGPGAGIIAVILSGLTLLDGNINHVLAAIVVSGAIQIVAGFLGIGRWAKMFPSPVLHGILAAIGVIIITKQIHFAFGTSSNADSIIDTLRDAVYAIPDINPFVLVISVTGVLILAFFKKIPLRFIHLLPAPMWVLVASIPFVFAFDFFSEHNTTILGNEYVVGPQFLISIPDNIIEGLMHPDFSMIVTAEFWMAVIAITLVASIETLASARAIDKLDQYQRVTNLNKELIGVGLSTMISGALGGLPIMTVIVRSTVNIQNNGKTKWSNFYHGVFVLAFVLILAPILQSIPLAALSAILIFTGYRLASPRVFYQAYDQGVEQLLFTTSTFVITLFTNLVYGIVGGVLITLILHMLLAKVGISEFFQMTFKSGSKIFKREDGSYDVKLKGIANFLSVLKLDNLLGQIPDGSVVRLDMSKTSLVDLSMMENMIEYKRIQDFHGGNVSITGLDHHWSSSSHNRALKIIVGPRRRKITKRQIQLQRLANTMNWTFEREVDWNTSYLRNFHFFESRPIELKTNSIRGKDTRYNANWEIADIVFDEGAMLSLEVFHTTVHLVRLNQRIPRFTVEKEGIFDKIFDRVKAFSGYTHHDLKLYPKVSRKFLLMGDDDAEMKKLFSDELIKFLEQHEIQHIESNGEALMIFRYLHIAPMDEIHNMLEFSGELLDHLNLKKG
ncbi:MAG: SulP family inorganic anion transporter [Cyclobacteriaceae bacterium]